MKKNFCDGWDNMLQLLVINLVFLIYGICAFFLIGAIASLSMIVAVSFSILCCAVGMIFVFACGNTAAGLANFETPHLKDFFMAIPGSVKDGLLFGLLTGFIGAAGFVGIPSYFSMGNLIGFTLGIMLVWLEIIAVLALQWFLSIRSLMHNDFKKCLKKSFIIFFDNPGFSIFVALYTLVLMVLSVFLFFLLPSVSGIVLAHTNALRLRLYKYDWLEQHPELKTRKEQKDIPWEELVENDRETLGPRKFKSFIFPWKD